jgi:hypothetical protein
VNFFAPLAYTSNPTASRINYLIDVKFGIIMDVEASRAIRQAEVGASQTMIERTEACFGIKPEWLVADIAYGSAANLDWLVNRQGIAPHVPVIDKSQREDGTFSREECSPTTKGATTIYVRQAIHMRVEVLTGIYFCSVQVAEFFQ